MNSSQSNTIVALATALGAGSIATVRVSGEDSIKIVNNVFIGKNIEIEKGNTIHFGRIQDGDIEIDQVLVSIFKSPHSYTGENSIEISCHANYFIVQDIISALTNNGARMADPGEFTLRAFLNNKMDLSQAEAISGIISSKSRLATRNSILQLEGNLSDKIIEIKKLIVDLISFLELDLDFSEEDIDVISKDKILEITEDTIRRVDQLLRSYNKAKYLSGALEIAIIGKPNAGKSMLLNALLGEERAIVTNVPGTTRDTIEENLSLKEMLLKISDTAGIRFSKNQVESKGIKRTWDRVDRSDLILWVIDMSKNMNQQDKEIFKTIKKNKSSDLIVVKNKMDLKPQKNNEPLINSFSVPAIDVSAKTGQGLDELKEQITYCLSDKYQNLGEEIIITNMRQMKILEVVKNYLGESKKEIRSEAGNEFIVVQLRNALNQLGLITGETATEDILNNIFSGFCIGK
jgi:tRNA modification GTPase